MKIITCASFHGSGSSVVTDLLSEYKNVHGLSDYEFPFVYMPDGLMDLEFNVVYRQDRHNSGFAVKRFKKITNFLSGTRFDKKFERFFHGSYKSLTNEYINRITNFSYKGFWSFDLYSKPTLIYYTITFFKKILGVFKIKKTPFMKKEITYCSHLDENAFLDYTKEYLSKLLRVLNYDNKEYLSIDQLLPPANTEVGLRYFSDRVYVLIIDRDPRDVYMLTKIAWKNDKVFPSDSVENFCKWFRYCRDNVSSANNKTIIKLQFEDFIFRYKETVDKIEKFTGLRSEYHTEIFTRFNPRQSVNNTMLFNKNTDFASDIAYIEKELKDYLYDFDSVNEQDVIGVDVKRVRPF